MRTVVGSVLCLHSVYVLLHGSCMQDLQQKTSRVEHGWQCLPKGISETTESSTGKRQGTTQCLLTPAVDGSDWGLLNLCGQHLARLELPCTENNAAA